MSKEMFIILWLLFMFGAPLLIIWGLSETKEYRLKKHKFKTGPLPIDKSKIPPVPNDVIKKHYCNGERVDRNKAKNPPRCP